MSSKVYFTDFRTQLDVSLTKKLQKLIRKAGIGEIDMDGKFVAIKMHFGELGNLAYLRPNYAKAVADVVKENGGVPFLTDCNTLYPGSRKNALEPISTASIRLPPAVRFSSRTVCAEPMISKCRCRTENTVRPH